MSLDDRIAEINRINTKLLIKNDRIGRTARKPDQEVRKMMTPTENEIVRDYETLFPPIFEYETGEVDENGVPIKKYRRYMLPDEEPELEEEPPIIEDISHLENGLKRTYTTLALSIQRIRTEINKYNKEIKDLTKLRNEEKISKEPYQAKLHEIQTKIEELKKTKSSYETQLIGVRKEKDDLQQNMKDHNAKVMEIRKRNQEKVRAYRDKISDMNKGAFSTEKGVNETEAEYLERLKRNAEIEEPEEELLNATVMINRQFRMKMRELISDVAKVEQVANGLDEFGKVENKYELMKNWILFKQKFLTSYGADNKRVTANDILTYINEFMKKTDSGLPTGVEQDIKAPTREGSVENIVFSTIPDENVFLMTNMETEKHLYLKPLIITEASGYPDAYTFVYSFTGKKESFKQFFDGYKSGIPYDRTIPYSVSGVPNKKLKSSDEIYNNTGIKKEQILKLFKESGSEVSANNISKKLIGLYHLKALRSTDTDVIRNPYTLTKNGAEVGIQYGYGIHSEKIPKIVPFGDLFLYMRKLYYENVLSVRNKHMKVIAGFRTIKISEPFMKLLLNMMRGVQPTHSDLGLLKTGEREVYDRLITLAHLNKNVVHQRDNTVNELKKRLKLLESEIEIGNNSPLIKKEIYGILHSLKDFKVITTSQINKYMKQF